MRLSCSSAFSTLRASSSLRQLSGVGGVGCYCFFSSSSPSSFSSLSSATHPPPPPWRRRPRSGSSSSNSVIFYNNNRRVHYSSDVAATAATATAAATDVAARSPAKPYYVSAPIFYVNAAPHIGHLYTMILADVLKRWQELKGRKALLSVGVDEHGMKVQRAAAAAGMDPKLFCDGAADAFKLLAQGANISHDFFVRTTAPEHKSTVQHIWTILNERGHIYRSKHEGWYSVSDEAFYPATAVHPIVEPRTGHKIMASKETGSEVEWVSESNYFFRLSAFREKLLDFYRANPSFIRPEVGMDYTVRYVEEGLADLSISRPTERLGWGIRVPDDDSQTIYVWFDALINYLTQMGYPWPPGEEEKSGWPADCHVIGKEIVRFHCVHWPALLMALGLPLPKHVLAHAHWTLGHRKMSKSTGNVVNPFFALSRYGCDTMRYYLAQGSALKDDTDYSNERIYQQYEFLRGALGNLLYRVFPRRGLWSVADAVAAGCAQRLPLGGDTDARMRGELGKVARLVDGAMERLNISRALRIIADCLSHTNKYLQHHEPWRMMGMAEKKGMQKRALLAIAVAVEAVRICSILLQPFIPTIAAKVLDLLAVDPLRRGFAFAEPFADPNYGHISPHEHETPLPKLPFPPDPRN